MNYFYNQKKKNRSCFEKRHLLNSIFHPSGILSLWCSLHLPAALTTYALPVATSPLSPWPLPPKQCCLKGPPLPTLWTSCRWLPHLATFRAQPCPMPLPCPTRTPDWNTQQGMGWPHRPNTSKPLPVPGNPTDPPSSVTPPTQEVSEVSKAAGWFCRIPLQSPGMLAAELSSYISS